MDNTDQTPDDYADTFNGTASDESSGYGLDPRQADSDAMAAAFDDPEVEVGGPIAERAIEANSLPDLPDEAQSIPGPAEIEAKSADPAESNPAAPEFKTFGQKFKFYRDKALNGGPKTFDWNGKQYTTQLKSESKAPVVAAKKSMPSKSAPTKPKAAAEAEKFEREFVNRDQPPAKPVDRSKTLAYKAGASSQPVNLSEDPTRIKTADEIATGVARTVKAVPSEPAPKDGKAWYQAGPKNTFIRNGDEPKNGPIYGNKPAGSKAENPRADEIYRGKGVYQGEMS